MNQTVDLDCTARPVRFFVSKNQQADVTLERVDVSDKDCQTIATTLIDISRKGVKLRLPVCLEVEETVRMRVEIPDAKLHCYVEGSVRYCQPADDNGYFAGFAVEPPLTDQAIMGLADAIGAEVRCSPRRPLYRPVVVDRPSSSATTEGYLQNISTGGLCVLTEDQLSAGEQILIQIVDDPNERTPTRVCVQWQLSTADGFLTGCRFLRSCQAGPNPFPAACP